jgi:hypothetical protein
MNNKSDNNTNANEIIPRYPDENRSVRLKSSCGIISWWVYEIAYEATLVNIIPAKLKDI